MIWLWGCFNCSKCLSSSFASVNWADLGNQVGIFFSFFFTWCLFHSCELHSIRLPFYRVKDGSSVQGVWKATLPWRDAKSSQMRQQSSKEQWPYWGSCPQLSPWRVWINHLLGAKGPYLQNLFYSVSLPAGIVCTQSVKYNALGWVCPEVRPAWYQSLPRIWGNPIKIWTGGWSQKKVLQALGRMVVYCNVDNMWNNH